MASDHSTSPGRLPEGTVESAADRYVWKRPLTDAAAAARPRVRLGAAVVVLVAAGWAAASVWADGADAVAFALIVPLMLAGMALGLDRLFAVGDQLRVEVSPTTLTVVRGRRRDVVALADIAALRVVNRAGTSGRPTAWCLRVDRPASDPLVALIPEGIGSAFDARVAADLQVELRRRCRAN